MAGKAAQEVIDGASLTGNQDEGPKENAEPKTENVGGDILLTGIGRFVKDDKGERIVDEAHWKLPARAEHENFALYVQPEDNKEEESHVKEKLNIVSPELRRIFREVIKFYPGIGLQGNRITFSEPYDPLYFYFKDICEYVKQNPDDPGRKDVERLQSFYNKWIHPLHERVEDDISEGMVQFDTMWAIFKPGELIYTLDEFNEPRLFMLLGCTYRDSDLGISSDVFPSRMYRRFCVDMWSIGWDMSAKSFERFSLTKIILPFTGSRPITSLRFYPVKYYKKGSLEYIDKLLSRTEARGRLWKQLTCQPPSTKNYSGAARELVNEYGSVSQLPDRINLDERIVVDNETPYHTGTLLRNVYHSPARNMSAAMNRWKKWDLNDDDLSVIGSGTIDGHEQYDNFTPDHDFDALQARLCPTTVSCYGMTSRRWYVITVESISEAKWANEAIEHLVLDESTKKIVLGLVQQHQKNKDRVLSDVIPSKGKGLVFVLHGPPGVGKTLTAESVAEYTQKPLFPMNIGEMVAENDLTSVLQDVFITATRWDAVLVLDEADVLLEKRSFEDLGRNGVVSVFLRMIEYYEGILFLTTNRIETMDIAFQSRIHIAIEFKALDSLVRRQIWENFIHRLDVGEAGAKKELLAALDDLQEWDLNGRQIRNVLSIAQSIALSSERRRGALRYEHVEHVASQTINFQHFFEGSTRDRKAQIGEISSRQFQERRGRGFR